MDSEVIASEGYKETELGPLPEDWEVIRLGELGEIITGNTPSKKVKEYWENGDIDFIKPPDLQNRYITTFSERISSIAKSKARMVPKDSILVSCIGIIGRAGYTLKTIAFNQQINAIVPNDNIHNLFLFFTLQEQVEQMNKLKSSTTVPIINKAKFSEIKVPLPPPPEQKAIAYVLSTIQEAKEKTEKVIQAAKELKKSLMKHLFTYGPVSLDEAKKIKLKKTEIGHLPENWEVIRLGKVIEVYDKARIPLSSNERKKMQGIYPYCGANGIIDYIDDYIFEGEYILLAEDGGFWSRFQNTAYIMKGKFWVNNHAHIIKALNDKTINSFILYWLIYEDVGKYTSGTTRKKLTQSIMKQMPIPLPPLTEQYKIASILSTIDQKIEAEENKKKALDELFKSMLHNLMTAKVRVNHLNLKVENA